MQKILSHPLVMLLTLILAGAILFSLQGTKQKTERGGEVVEKNQATVDELRQTADQLRNQLEESQSTFEKEKVLRDELLEQKEGEVVIQLPAITPIVSPSPTPTPTLTPWQQWRGILRL